MNAEHVLNSRVLRYLGSRVPVLSAPSAGPGLGSDVYEPDPPWTRGDGPSGSSPWEREGSELRYQSTGTDRRGAEASHGLKALDAAPHVRYSPGVDVVVWLPRAV
jgi:hypothetical protein